MADSTASLPTGPPPNPQNQHPSPPYPTPLTIPPLSGTHKQTLIALHGRGSTAHAFGPALLLTSTPGDPPSTTTNLPSALPNTKLLFPTASKRRARAFNRALIP